ncbi:MAG: response regulator transcription factor [Spirochaetales bacterium]|jgi:DNA-binding NarL/FixJ family response regulator|nr:response regulator transcription factor [Spirochaetales bacterium]
MEQIKVFLVDDQVLFINSLKTVLETKDDEIKVIGVCYNGQDAVSFCKTNTPDLILMDVKMPGIDGVEATRLIIENQPEVKIIMLTTFDEDEYVKNALKVGARGYLLKDMLPDDLIYAIKNVNKGLMYISPAFLFQESKKEDGGEKPSWYANLNEKEIEILALITQGYDNNEISEKVNLAKQTVKNYVSSIYEIIDVRDRMQAMRLCIDLKIFDEH